MNTLKLLAAVAVVGLLAPAARADEKADYAKKIVGKWELTKVEEGGLPKGTIVDFDKDGKVKVAAKVGDQDLVLEGTYKVEGESLMLTMKMGEEERKQTVTILKLDDKVMHTKNEAGKMSELTKK